MLKSLFLVCLTLALFSLASVVSAQTFSVGRLATPAADLGKVVSAASGDTVFRIDASTGAVTRVSGTGTRTTSGSTRATIAISCARGGKTDLCSTTGSRVTIGAIGSTGRARSPVNFNVTPGTAVFNPPKSANTISFEVQPFGETTVTFFLGADLGIEGDTTTSPTGTAESEFYVTITQLDGSDPRTSNGFIEAIVLKPLSISNSSALNFGTVSAPASGAGTVSVDAGTGARTVSGGVTTVPTPLPSRATFNITGEGGQTLSITIPPSFQMKSGGQILNVSTTSTAAGAQALSGKAGGAGSLALGVGGSFSVTDATRPGNYTGTFTVSVSYN